MSLKSYNQKIEYKTANQIQFGCSRKEEDAVINETDLQFTMINLWLVNIQKNSKTSFGGLTAISCPLNALDTFT